MLPQAHRLLLVDSRVSRSLARMLLLQRSVRDETPTLIEANVAGEEFMARHPNVRDLKLVRD
jgi:hypothetical protein